jgi:WD40 repeat protein
VSGRRDQAFTRRDQIFATAPTARLWEVATGKQIATISGHVNGVSSVAFSPDGRTLATGSLDKTAAVGGGDG